MRLRILVVSLFFASVSVAMADSDWHGKLTIGGDYQGSTDIDDPDGEFDFWHTNVSAHAQRRLGDDSRWAVALQGEYRAFGYRFRDLPPTSVNNPWGTAHVVRLSPRLMYTIDDTWSLFGGPIAEFSGESGAQFSNSIRGGALFGAQWRGSENLTIGLGVLGITEIEDDFLIQPVLIVDWKISDSWRLTTQSWTSRGGRLEIIHSFGDGFEASVAGGRERERFRLDRSKTATGGKGVGEESSLPITLTVSKTMRDGMRIDVYGGIVVNGELRVEDERGNGRGVSDFDRSFFGGAALTMPF